MGLFLHASGAAALPVVHRVGWSRLLRATLAVVMCAALGHAGAQTITATKRAVDPVTGATLTSATPGQPIRYVIEYSVPGNPVPNVTLTDTMVGATYTGGSVRSGSSWTVQNQPAVFDANNMATLTNPLLFSAPPGMAAVGNPTSPPAAALSTASGGGDGFTPILYLPNNTVFEIYHHLAAGTARINCQSLVTGANCAGYPRALTDSITGLQLGTPNSQHYVQLGSRVYFPASAAVAGGSTGIGCWDMAANAACAYVPLGPTPTSFIFPNSSLGGVAAVPALPGVVFMQSGGRAYCHNVVANTPCPALAGATPTAPFAMVTDLVSIGNRIFINQLNNGGQLNCIDFSGGLPGVQCTGSWPKLSLGVSNYAHLTAGGVADGVCHSPATGYVPPSVSICYDFAGNVLPNPPVISNPSVVFAPLQVPGTAKVLIPEFGSSQTSCWDFATNARCIGFTDGGPGAVQGIRRWQQAGPGAPAGVGVVGATSDYGYVPYGNGCFLGLGDTGILWSFDLNGNAPCLNIDQVVNIPSAIEQYCDNAARSFLWQTLSLVNVPPQMYSGSLTVYQADGVTVFGTFPFTNSNPATTTLNFSIPGLPFIPGNTLKVRVVGNYSAIPPPSAPPTYATATAVASDGASPQICYNATVNPNACAAGGAVTNTVNFNGAGGSVVTNATSTLQCLPGKLDVAKSVGTYNQVGPSRFQVPYQVAVQNTGVSPVANVQVVENFVRTFFGAGGIPPGASVALVAAPVAAALGATPIAKCAVAASAFNGSTQPALMAGNQSLSGGEGCTYAFSALVDYGNTPVPLTPRNNFVYGTGSNVPQTPGTATVPVVPDDPAASPIYPAGVTQQDTSTGTVTPGAPGTTPPAPPVDGATPPSPAPVTFLPQQIDATKSAGVPRQIAPGRYEIAYGVTVGNRGTQPVFNVQVVDNLVRTYFGAGGIPAGASLAVATPVIVPLAGTAPGKCAAAAPVFNGNTQQGLLAGNQTLAQNEGCQISFVVTVDYGPNPVPLTSRENQARATASTVPQTPTPGTPALPNVPNDPNTPPVYPPQVVAIDSSTNVAPPPGGVPGAPPAAPALPATAGGDTATPTPVLLGVQRIDTVKRAGIPRQTAPGIYEVGYSLTVGNLGAVPTPNVQLVDNLVRTFFGAGGIPAGGSVTTTTPAITPLAGTPAGRCAAATPAYNGNTQIALLAGNQTLLVNEGCQISFVATVNYGSASVPTTTRDNFAFATGNANPQTPGGPNVTTVPADPALNPVYPPSTTTNDVSTDSPAPAGGTPGAAPPAPPLPASANADAPLVTSVLLGVQRLDVTKSGGAPRQTGPASFDVGYAMTLANRGTQAVPNVQVMDNLVRSFFGAAGMPAGASLTVTVPTIAPLGATPGASCAGASPAFNGNSQQALLAGTQSLAAGQGCLISFVVSVNYGNTPVPASLANSAFGSGNLNPQPPGGPNLPVIPNDPNSPPVFPPNTPSTDTSTDVPPPSGGTPGAVPPPPPPPGTPNGDTPTPTVVLLMMQKIDVVKAAGVPRYTDGKRFEVPYRLLVGNQSTITATNVQVSDQLYATFPQANPANAGGGVTVKPGSYQVSNGANTSVCLPAASYDGVSATTLLAGNFDLAPAQSCRIEFIAMVDFGANAVPTVPQNNTAYASSASGPNAGYSFGASGAVQAPPVNVVATDISADVTPVGTTGVPGDYPAWPTSGPAGLPTTPGGDASAGVPTPVSLLVSNSPLFLIKTVNKAEAEIGDTVRYQLTIKSPSGGLHRAILITDRLPAGFRYIPGTTLLNGVKAADPQGGVGPVLVFPAGDLPRAGTGGNSNESVVTYTVRVGVGAQQGDGINRARGRSQAGVQSNEARARVKVTGGVFTTEACVAGKVFVDCNNNHVQDAEELGVPGVRLYLEDGTWFITDSEGKYSYCGLKPTTHGLKIDPLTLPRGSRMTTTSSRNVGDGNSLFLDTKNGELIRGDFAEGSCSNRVIEQVKARRSQGEVRSPENEKPDLPGLSFKGKAPGAARQASDSANQPIVKPRTDVDGVLKGDERVR